MSGVSDPLVSSVTIICRRAGLSSSTAITSRFCCGGCGGVSRTTAVTWHESSGHLATSGREDDHLARHADRWSLLRVRRTQQERLQIERRRNGLHRSRPWSAAAGPRVPPCPRCRSTPLVPGAHEFEQRTVTFLLGRSCCRESRGDEAAQYGPVSREIDVTTV